jgi:hypothetical protein
MTFGGIGGSVDPIGAAQINGSAPRYSLSVK